MKNNQVKNFFYFAILLTHIIIGDNNVSNAITYELNGGRFGDNLLSYSRAKWLSYKYDIPLHFLPFPYAEQLMLSHLEQKLSIDNFKHVIKLTSEKDITNAGSSTLYINHWNSKVTIDWNDMVFVSLLKEMIRPCQPITTVSIPQGYISVAVHVRRGGNFAADTPQEEERCPLRFLSDEFFIAQIDRIAQMFPDDALYVYIFTDDKNPKKIAQKFRDTLNNERIIFDYQKSKNAHNINVLEDFFSMMQFDCLIRPGSHFSRFVERLGDATLVIYPQHYKKVKEGTVIDVIGIKTRRPDGRWKTEKRKIT